MEVTRELRSAISDLVRRCKEHQSRALALNTALIAIMQLPPTKRADLKPADIEEYIQKNQKAAREIADEIARQLEQALASDRDFLLLLELYGENPKHEL
jgi:hypothetical protein